MSRSAAHICPVKGCGNLRARWAAVCRTCWNQLPVDLRQAISSAKAEKAPHRVASAAIAATNWLNEHRPAAEISKRTGEAL